HLAVMVLDQESLEFGKADFVLLDRPGLAVLGGGRFIDISRLLTRSCCFGAFF
uniref:Uncharacterized protein n=1 Tax=Leptobrachium leishanense TaxID=445787 RepID=A0A8C5QN50_9ANUR